MLSRRDFLLTNAIRRADDDDLASVIACLAEAFEPYRDAYSPDAFRDTVPTPEAMQHRLRAMTVLVAEDRSGAMLGTIAHQIVGPGEGHLRGMAVVQAAQGKGVADRLLGAAEGELRALGCSRVTLDSTKPLERAIRFYTRHGYRRTGIVKDFFGMELFEYAKLLVERRKAKTGEAGRRTVE